MKRAIKWDNVQPLGREIGAQISNLCINVEVPSSCHIFQLLNSNAGQVNPNSAMSHVCQWDCIPPLSNIHVEHSLPQFQILEKGNDVFEHRAKRVVLSAVIFIVFSGHP